MLKNQPNALHPERFTLLMSFYFDFKQLFNPFEEPSFSQIRKLFKSRQMGLLHSFRCKNEDPIEYYALWFQILLEEFKDGLFETQIVDISFLHILMETMPPNQINIHLTLPIILALEKFAENCKSKNKREMSYLLFKLLKKGLIVPSAKFGLTTVLLHKNGKIRKITDSQNVLAKFEIDSANWKQQLQENKDFDALNFNSREYNNLKGEYFQDFVREDCSLKIVFDQKRKKLMKSTELELCLFDETAVKDLVKLRQSILKD